MAYKDVVLADAPVGYWKLDETTGTTAADSSGFGRGGTYVGSPSLGRTPAVGGGSAASFSGSSDYVTVPHDNAFSFTGDFTLEAWVWPTNYSNYTLVITKTTAGGAANDNYEMQLQPNGIPQFVQQNAGGQQVLQGTKAAPLNRWSHVVMTKAGGTFSFYINGALTNTGAVATTGVTTNTLPLLINTRDDRYSYGGGWIDEVAVYNTALPAARVLAHFTAGALYKDMVLGDGTVAYWRLDESSGTVANDSSATGKTATYAGLIGSHGFRLPSGVKGGFSHGITNASFNTTGPYIDCGYGAPFANPTAFTMECWVYTTQPTNQNEGTQIIGCHNNASRGYTVLMDARAGNTQPFKLHYRMLDSAQVVQGVTGYALSAWHHIVATYDGATYALYGDGALDASAARTAGPGDCTVNNTFCIGSVAVGWGGPAGYNGRVAEAAFYPTALSAARIKTHYEVGLQTLLQRWTGSAWAPSQTRRWDGTEWVPAWPKRWDGTAWT